MAEVGWTLLSGLAGRRMSSGLPVGQCPTYLTGVHECVATSTDVWIGIAAHQADFGAPLVVQAFALKDNWMTVYTASEAATGAKTTTQEEKRMARENLQLVLFLNLLKLAEMFPRQPEKLPMYMQQHLLENPQESAPEPEPEPPAE